MIVAEIWWSWDRLPTLPTSLLCRNVIVNPDDEDHSLNNLSWANHEHIHMWIQSIFQEMPKDKWFVHGHKANKPKNQDLNSVSWFLICTMQLPSRHMICSKSGNGLEVDQMGSHYSLDEKQREKKRGCRENNETEEDRKQWVGREK